jgi:hypothetical protein
MENYNRELLARCSYANWKDILANKGYAYFNKGKYNLNIIGVRSDERSSNEFNDAFIVEYWDNTGSKCTRVYPCTTDPGFKSLVNPVNAKGCAILVPDQYRGCFKDGKHKGQYEALVQYKPVKVYRDNNKDKVLDFDPTTIEEGMFGINIHKAGAASIIVDGWSAGCQVLAREEQYDQFRQVVKLAIPNWGDIFTYTLLEEKSL